MSEIKKKTKIISFDAETTDGASTIENNALAGKRDSIYRRGSARSAGARQISRGARERACDGRCDNERNYCCCCRYDDHCSSRSSVVVAASRRRTRTAVVVALVVTEPDRQWTVALPTRL